MVSKKEVCRLAACALRTGRFVWFVVIFTTFAASQIHAGTVNLPKTGQTTTLAPGDDDSKQAGVAWPNPRFTDNGSGTVTDNLTGLVWLKNADCFSAVTWDTAISSANSLASGSCGLTDGSAAGDDWRLPNITELGSLVDAKQYNQSPWLNNIAFLNAQSDWYWSGTTYAPNTNVAWFVVMSYGFVDVGNTSNYNHVWPVHSGQ